MASISFNKDVYQNLFFWYVIFKAYSFPFVDNFTTVLVWSYCSERGNGITKSCVIDMKWCKLTCQVALLATLWSAVLSLAQSSIKSLKFVVVFSHAF